MLAEFIQLPKEGESIGPYLLREMLSSSILGAFYQATHKLKHEDVLIHILPEALLRADSRFQQKYKETVEKQKQLPAGGPAMAALELHRISGNLVVQYPAGKYRSLNQLVIRSKEPLPEDRVQQLLKSVAKGLVEARKLEQGHYFMTPDFLFLNEQGDIRIAGLGLFQSIQYECFERFVSGAVIPVTGDKKKSFSALEILSPEIRNFKARDQRSDFYCFGMCAYFLLTGTKPERRWATPTKARKEIGEGWDIFISRCLEPKPTDRFANYRSFQHDLEHIDELTATSAENEDKRINRTLNRVPLPQAIENLFNIRHLLFVRLIFLGIAGVLTILTASMFYQIIFSDFSTEVSEQPLRRVATADQANLIIITSPRNATVSIRGPQSGRYNPGGFPLHLKGKNGRYTVQVGASKHRSIIREVDLVGSKPVEMNLNLQPDFATVHISGAVGTEVYIMPESGFLLHLGTIEQEAGLTIENRLLTGTHQIIGLHKSLQPAVTEETLFGRARVELKLKQPPKPTELIVTSDPTGATVTVDGAILGLTPLTVTDLAFGRLLDLRIAKEGYREITREIQFQQGESKSIDSGPMELKIGTLRYRLDLTIPNAPDLRELVMSVNGSLLAVKESGELELPEGGHMLKVEHPDYYTFDERIVVIDRKVTDVGIVLQPRPVRLTPILKIDVPARFRVEGKFVNLTEQGILPIPANRTVEVEANIRDHLSVLQSFKGAPNERMVWEIPLRPIPGPVYGENWSPPYFDLDMVWMEPGTFLMGSPVDELRRLPNEDAETKVTLETGFWMGVHEVTQRVYRQLMRENPSEFPGDEFPVDSVSWEDAKEFCQRLTLFERDAGRLPSGWVYRLPSEAEWEYAAQAGQEQPFSFGGSASPEDGNFHGTYPADDRADLEHEEHYGSLPVGSFPPNGFGLYDVHGNVAEWTIERFWDRHPGGSVVNPVNLKSGRGYTVKGGSWRDTADRVRIAAREGVPGRSVRNSLGFRIVLAPVAVHNSR